MTRAEFIHAYETTFRDDVAAFFLRPLDEIERGFDDDRKRPMQQTSMHGVDIGDPQSIRASYRHKTWLRHNWTPHLRNGDGEYRAAAIRKYGTGKRVLEYGAGSGAAALSCAAEVEHLTLADIETDWSRFLAWRSRRWNWPVEILHVDGELPLRGREPWGMIVCWEVLEHVYNPICTLLHLSDHLVLGGVLALSTFFNDCGGQDPSHLPWNNVFQDTYLWFEMLRRVGFELLERDANGSEKVFRKVREPQFNLPKSDKLYRTGRWDSEEDDA